MARDMDIWQGKPSSGIDATVYSSFSVVAFWRMMKMCSLWQYFEILYNNHCL